MSAYFNNKKITQPTIVISSCLAGEKVRYDGKNKQHSQLGNNSYPANIVSCCPEVGAGLSVPRPPVQLIKTNNGIEAIGVDNPQLNVTAALQEFSDRFQTSAQPQAFILKSRSPSCGISNTPIYNSVEDPYMGSGIFAEAMHKRYPLSFLLDDEKIQNAEDMHTLIRHCLLAQDLQLTHDGDLQDFCQHHAIEFLYDETTQNTVFNYFKKQLLRQLS